MSIDAAQNVFTILYRNKGVVYGGYVRDMIAGVQPRDIDVVLPADKWDTFVEELLDAGYVSQDRQDNDATLFTKDGFLDVEAYACEDNSYDDVFIGPEASPDFDVNTLAYDGVKMYNWANPNGMDIFIIIQHIQTRFAVRMEPEDDRVEKILSKGYKII